MAFDRIKKNAHVQSRCQMTQQLDVNKPQIFMCNLNNPVERWLLSVGWDHNNTKTGLSGWMQRLYRSLKAPDYDVSLLAFDARYNPVEIIYYDCAVNLSGSISHSCHNHLKPQGRANQAIALYPQQIDAQIQHLFVVVSGFSGRNLADLQRVYCLISNCKTGRVFASLSIDRLSAHHSLAILQLTRVGNGWQAMTLDHRMAAIRLEDIVQELRPLLMLREEPA